MNVLTKLFIVCSALSLISCGSPTGPDMPEQSQIGVDSIAPKPTTGSITIIICWEGVCPDTTGTG